ncbi:uncharacterized protein LOC125759248 [Rhipicephalus sanguineus]|uniref:uncharacterized protein LOC125759248 n=1 Tax=Rhipicephalus sanguineus TaxID=34632 RepID=UPI0020C3A89B|nr:uncharacterized protein LOC125759248 [Rhipicephalus sanguineus]
MSKTPLLLLQMLPWFFVGMPVEDDGSCFFVIDAQRCRNGSLECALSGLAATGVTSPATSLQKGQRENIGFRGHGIWLANKMSKTPLLLLQMLPWFFVGMPVEDDGSCFFVIDAQRCRNGSLECALSGLAATGVTSPATSLQKGQRENIGFRGHGIWLANKMSKTPLLLLQVSYSSTYRSDNRCLLVLPCPRRCCAILNDCWSVLLLLMAGDVEENPGPKTAEMLQEILEKQNALGSKVDDIRKEIAEVNAKTDKMQSVLSMFDEMKDRIDKLETIVREQNDKLIDYENRSRRNNLLVFGLTESASESVQVLKRRIVNDIFSKVLGIEVTKVERIHRIGKVNPDKPRPVILKFYDSKEKDTIFKNCAKLKGTSIRISNDYAKETVQIRKKLWQSAALDRGAGAKVVLVHDKLRINDDLYAWDDVRGKRYLHSDKRGTDTTKRSERVVSPESNGSDSPGSSFETPEK